MSRPRFEPHLIGLTIDVLSMVVLGAAAGLALGIWSAKYAEALLYGVRATDAPMLAVPTFILFGTAVLVATPAAIRAAQIDPVVMLREE